jgi:hypothetical protein
MLDGDPGVWKNTYGLQNVAVLADPAGSMMGGSNGTPTITIVNPRNMKVRGQQIGYNPNAPPPELLQVAAENVATPAPPIPLAEGDDITDSCEQQCTALYPAGEAAYLAKRECLLCTACGDICEANIPGACVERPETSACGSNATSCAACVTSNCAVIQDALGQASGVCASTASVCAANGDCFKLNNCVAQCAAQSVN